MKIYCSRNQSDTQLLDSLIGSDVWILVRLLPSNKEYYIQLISKDNDWQDYYLFRWLPGMLLDDIYQREIINWDDYGIDNIVKHIQRFICPWVRVHKPIEILSDEEVFGEFADEFIELKQICKKNGYNP